MAAVFDLSDNSVVAVIGSGAGGGTLGNGLAQKGIDVVCRKAGPRMSANSRGGVVTGWGQTHNVPNLFVRTRSVQHRNGRKPDAHDHRAGDPPGVHRRPREQGRHLSRTSGRRRARSEALASA